MRVTVDAHDAIQAHIPLLVTLLSRQDVDLRFSIIEALSKISVDSRCFHRYLVTSDPFSFHSGAAAIDYIISISFKFTTWASKFPQNTFFRWRSVKFATIYTLKVTRCSRV
jgi:hypothetical protein